MSSLPAGERAVPEPALSASVDSAHRVGMSVRTRLLLWLVVPLLQIVIFASLMDYRAIDRTVDEAFDRVLLNSAVAIGESVRGDDLPGTIRLPVDRLKVLLSDPVDTLDYRIVGPRGETLAGNARLPLPPDDSEAAFYDVIHDGQEMRAVRIVAPTDADIVSVVVAETQRKRRRSQEHLRSSLLAEDAMILALTVVLSLLAVSMALKPLERMAAQLARRSPADLTPVVLDKTPGEVRPLADALNRLFERLTESRDAQRRFVENAAHQLRTPLTGIKGQLELALAQVRALPSHPPADLPGEAAALENRLSSAQYAVDRLAHLTHQLLTLSRADQTTRDASMPQQVPMAELVDEVVSIHVDAALARGQDLGAETLEVTVPGSRWQLREMLNNLVDNAIRYSPVGGRITVRCGLLAGHPFAEVEDSGPGIDPAERRRVFERFYRSPTAIAEGSGLGLAIVREIAQSHDAQVRVIDVEGGSGIVVRVLFRSASGAPAADT